MAADTMTIDMASRIRTSVLKHGGVKWAVVLPGVGWLVVKIRMQVGMRTQREIRINQGIHNSIHSNEAIQTDKSMDVRQNLGMLWPFR